MNLKSLMAPLEELMEAQLIQIDLLVTRNDVLENQVKSLTVALTKTSNVNHALNAEIDYMTKDTYETEYDTDTVNEELQFAAQDSAEDEFDIVIQEQTVVPVAGTVDSIIARMLMRFDSQNADKLSTDDLLKLAEFKRIWSIIEKDKR